VAKIVSERLFVHLVESGFVVMRKRHVEVDHGSTLAHEVAHVCATAALGDAFEPQRGPLSGLGRSELTGFGEALVAESCIHVRGPQAGLRVALAVAPRPVVRLAPWTKREQRGCLNC
jgi:hypothetical protein